MRDRTWNYLDTWCAILCALTLLALWALRGHLL